MDNSFSTEFLWKTIPLGVLAVYGLFFLFANVRKIKNKKIMVTYEEFEKAVFVLESNDSELQMECDDAFDMIDRVKSRDYHLLPLAERCLNNKINDVRIFGWQCLQRILTSQDSHLIPLIESFLMPLIDEIITSEPESNYLEKVLKWFKSDFDITSKKEIIRIALRCLERIDVERTFPLSKICELIHNCSQHDKIRYLLFIRNYGMQDPQLAVSTLRTVAKDERAFIGTRLKAWLMLCNFRKFKNRKKES